MNYRELIGYRNSVSKADQHPGLQRNAIRAGYSKRTELGCTILSKPGEKSIVISPSEGLISDAPPKSLKPQT